MRKLVNIAIDGPSASGKSTIAKALAKRLSYTHIDTGAMYRASAYKIQQSKLDLNDKEALVNCIKTSDFSFNEQGDIMLDGVNVQTKIRTKDIDILTSKIAQIAELRHEMVKRQHAMVQAKGFVMDGRDIGSVVLPEAEVKIFQTASLQARAQRRFDQYQSQGLNITYQQIYDEIKQRDENDMHRQTSPLIQMPDAFLLDTSHLSVKQSVDKALAFIDQRLKELSDD
jgi:cytidylate kinase